MNRNRDYTVTDQSVVIIRYWLGDEKEKTTGHVSLQTSSIYASFWPLEASDKDSPKTCHYLHNIKEDYDAYPTQEPEEIKLSDLNVSAINQRFLTMLHLDHYYDGAKGGLPESYRGKALNCCSLVHILLKAGAGSRGLPDYHSAIDYRCKPKYYAYLSLFALIVGGGLAGYFLANHKSSQLEREIRYDFRSEMLKPLKGQPFSRPAEVSYQESRVKLKANDVSLYKFGLMVSNMVSFGFLRLDRVSRRTMTPKDIFAISQQLKAQGKIYG